MGARGPAGSAGIPPAPVCGPAGETPALQYFTDSEGRGTKPRQRARGPVNYDVAPLVRNPCHGLCTIATEGKTVSNNEGSERAVDALARVQTHRNLGTRPDALVMGRAVQPLGSRDIVTRACR